MKKHVIKGTFNQIKSFMAGEDKFLICLDDNEFINIENCEAAYEEDCYSSFTDCLSFEEYCDDMGYVSYQDLKEYNYKYSYTILRDLGICIINEFTPETIDIVVDRPFSAYKNYFEDIYFNLQYRFSLTEKQIKERFIEQLRDNSKCIESLEGFKHSYELKTTIELANEYQAFVRTVTPKVVVSFRKIE